MKEYELALVIHPELEAEGRDGLVDLVDKIVKQFDGEITKREDGGKKVLAYPIKKMNEGWYYYMFLKLNPEKISALETKLRLEEKKLRYLIMTKTKGIPAGSKKAMSKDK